MKTPLEIATLFHDTYERLAPNYGYETRKDTRQFDPTTPNGKLMVAVAGEVSSILEHRWIPLSERKPIRDDADPFSHVLVRTNMGLVGTNYWGKIDNNIQYWMPIPKL